MLDSKAQSGPVLRLVQTEAPKTRTDATLRRLRRDIIACRLKPGAKLRADELCRAYGVGTSPLREALFQLVSEGLVRSDGQRGFRVAGISLEDLRDITARRMQLECEALRTSIEKGDVEWEAGLLAGLHRLERTEGADEASDGELADRWEEVHRSFHFSLYAACGSPWLLRFCEIMIEQGERYRRGFVIYRRIDDRIGSEHRALVEAAVERRPADAEEILREHIGRAAQLATRYLELPGEGP